MDDKNSISKDKNWTRVFGVDEFGFEGRARQESAHVPAGTAAERIPGAVPESIPAPAPAAVPESIPAPAPAAVPESIPTPAPAVAEDAATLDPAELARRFDALSEDYRSQKMPGQIQQAPAPKPAAPPPVPEPKPAAPPPAPEPKPAAPPPTPEPKPAAPPPVPEPKPAAPPPAPEPKPAAPPPVPEPKPAAPTPAPEPKPAAPPPAPVQKPAPPADDLEAEFRRMHGASKPAAEVPAAPVEESPYAMLSEFEKKPPSLAPMNETEEDQMAERAEMRRQQRERENARQGQRRKQEAAPRNSGSNGKNGNSGKNGSSGKNGNNPRNNMNSKKKKKKKKESIVSKILKGVLSAILILIIAVAVIGTVYVYGIVKDMPRYTTYDFEASLKVMSTMYDDQGTPMKNIYLPEGQRILATYDQVPQDLIDALVAIEDKTFWSHKGFNIIRIAGAILESWRGGGGISGTSTLTQQLARNIWLIDERNERTAERKIKEAFYARELEKNLTKEEILMAYLNTIALGNHSYGIQAAAENYYGKPLEKLDLIECAALAALPKAPSEYAMILTVTPGDVELDDPRILLVGSQYIYLYNSNIEPRLKLVLSEMYDQGYLTSEQYDTALKQDIRSRLHPRELEADSNADFFVSFAIDTIADDLLKSDPGLLTRDEAIQKIYSGGLDIYTTFNQRAQDIATEEFENSENFPHAQFSDADPQGNLLDDTRTNIMLFKYEYMFEEIDGEPWFHFVKDGAEVPYSWREGEERRDYEWRDDGALIIFSGMTKRLGVYQTNGPGGPDINLEFKDFYSTPDGILYITKGGYIPIPVEYKGIDSGGNMIISKKYFEQPDNIFKIDEDDELWISPKHFTLRQDVLQPQSAFVLIDHTNGQLKAMVGGRGIKGQFQYNRTVSPRQPGSTVKPIGVYGPALEMSANGEPVGGSIPTYGQFWTPLSIIIDEEMTYQGRVWPKNWYSGYRGPLTMRNSIENSININAVKVQLAIGDQRSITFLKKLGITTLVEEGARSDLAPGALALGGMTKGMTPLEIASAYGTFANAGLHIKPIAYTLIKDKHGNIMLDGTPESNQAMDAGAAFIMNDMLRTTVTSGIATNARVAGTQIAGKTGTTSDYYDAWFVGNTPKYAASVWIGCDVSVRLSAGSAAAATLFSRVMTRIIEDEDQGEYPPQPENVVSATVSSRSVSNPENVKTFTDYFLVGTVPEYIDLGVEEVEVCGESGYIATPWCPTRDIREFSTLKSSEEDEIQTPQAPEFFCHLHNLDPEQFQPNPFEPFNYDFGKAEVPALKGLTLAKATAALKAVGLEVGQIFPHPPDAGYSPNNKDVVISQNPDPGTFLPEGAVVNVTVTPYVPPPEPEPDPEPEVPEPVIPETGGPVTPARLDPFSFIMKYYSSLLSRVAS